MNNNEIAKTGAGIEVTRPAPTAPNHFESGGKDMEVFNIKNIHDSLADDVKAGALTIEEAAAELYKAGWTNWIDVERTVKLLHLDA